MKVLALGGSGDMGRMAVWALVSSPKVTSITIADKNVELAKRFVELQGSIKLSVVEIDVTQQDRLIELISKHDLVVNTVGPFFKFGKIILEAVIKAKKNYVDICDDWKPMLEMLNMTEAAKTAGITAILGMGASPGILNLMAVQACSELDEVDELITGWGLGAIKSGRKPKDFIPKKKLVKKSNTNKIRPSAAILHLLHEAVGKIPTYKDGKMIEIDALKETEPIKFPGIRDFNAVHVGHPEPITLPRTLKAKSISNVMYLGKTITGKLRKYCEKISNQQLTFEEATIAIEKILNSTTALLLIFWELLKRFFKLPPELWVIATGKKLGLKKKVTIGLKWRPWGEIDEGMDAITAIPMVIAALMIIDGKIQKKGVFTPEESVDPKEFFNRYVDFCKPNLKGSDVLIQKIVDIS